jgi:uncharacterized protein YgbK (DUF1537 family)
MKFPLRIGVMTDDLTGAGDVGGCFARAGYKTVISLPLSGTESGLTAKAAQGKESADSPEIYVLDTESRGESPAVAEARVAEAFWTLAALGTNFFYKKIDSTLRGNVGPEMDAFLGALLAWKSNGISEGNFSNPASFSIPVAPAYPAVGRQTREGWQYVNGSRSQVHVPTLLQETCSSWPFFRAEDCLRSSDLKQTASALFRDFSKAGFAACVASGGLADQMVKALGSSSRLENCPESRSRLPTVIVCGSRHPSSLAQVERFLDSFRESVVIEGPGSSEAPWSEVVKTFSRSRHQPAVIVRAPQREGRSWEVGEWLARTTRRLLMTLGPTRLILMGGDTAFRVCDGLGVRKLVIQGMTAPGIAVCRPMGQKTALTRKIVLKPGGFGSPSTLINILKN